MSEQTAEKDIESKEEVDKAIRQYTIGSMGVGLIPVPLIDIAALTAVQLKLLHRMANIYQKPFVQSEVKPLLTALVGSTITVSVARTLSSLVKFVPLIGSTTGMMTMPVLAGASTYAVGKAFKFHFDAGGSFSDFNKEKMKAYYAKMFNEGKEVAENLKKETSGTAD